MPVFQKLNSYDDISVAAFYSEGFEDRRVRNARNIDGIEHFKLFTIKGSVSSSKREALFIITPNLFKKLYQFKPDVIFAEGAANIFNNLLFIFPFAKIFKIPIIWHTSGELENYPYKGLSKIYRKLVRQLELRSEIFLSYSSLGLRYAKNIGLNTSRCKLAVNNIDTDKVKEKIVANIEEAEKIKNSPIFKGKFLYLFVGEIEKDKRLDLLLHAYLQVLTKTENVHLIIIGEGYEKNNIMALAESLGIENEITFTGKIIEKVNAYFQCSDVFVLPGRGGLAIPQAMINGLPVICGIADGTEWDFVIDGVTGYRIRTFEDSIVINQLVEKMNLLKSNYQLRASMARNAVDLVNKKYNINSFVNSIYEAVLDADKTSN